LGSFNGKGEAMTAWTLTFRAEGDGPPDVSRVRRLLKMALRCVAGCDAGRRLVRPLIRPSMEGVSTTRRKRPQMSNDPDRRTRMRGIHECHHGRSRRHQRDAFCSNRRPASDRTPISRRRNACIRVAGWVWETSGTGRNGQDARPLCRTRPEG
jgi:hypothetical protein